MKSSTKSFVTIKRLESDYKDASGFAYVCADKTSEREKNRRVE